MHDATHLPWDRIHEFLLDVGRIQDPGEFCVQIVEKIYPLIPYDKGRIYFVGGDSKVRGEALFGVDKYWSDAYLEHYSKLENGRYAIPGDASAIFSKQKRGHRPIPDLVGGVYDWVQVDPDEFVIGYIRPQGLRHSAGVCLHGADGLINTVYMLDRTSRSGFSSGDIEVLEKIHPHLENLHRNLTIHEPNRAHRWRTRSDTQCLTEREAEIAALICEGLTPGAISRRLCLTLPTVYRHIANMHKKLAVSNRQELLLVLMSS